MVRATWNGWDLELSSVNMSVSMRRVSGGAIGGGSGSGSVYLVRYDANQVVYERVHDESEGRAFKLVEVRVNVIVNHVNVIMEVRVRVRATDLLSSESLSVSVSECEYRCDEFKSNE